MPDVEITRKQIIVVDKVGSEKSQYGERLTWTDKEGKSYKVKMERKQYFEAIVPGQAVEISFASYRNNEYPYSAEKVELPTVEATHLKPNGGLEPQTVKGNTAENEMTKSDWADKDRITRKSIERQTSLKEATNISCAIIAQGKEMSAAKTIDIAKLFEAYLEGNPLVEEAKKLGAKELEPF